MCVRNDYMDNPSYKVNSRKAKENALMLTCL